MTLYLTPGAPSLAGTDADDLFTYTSLSGFKAVGLLDGGAGVDTLRFTADLVLCDGMLAKAQHLETLELDGSGAQKLMLGNAAAQAFGGVVVVDASAAGSLSLNATAMTAGGHVVVAGSAGQDIIQGSAGDDTIQGGAGNDQLRGHGGADILDGGAGDDRLLGGAGNDQIDGGTGNDRLDGDDGDDQICGDAGHDTLNGGAGNDLLWGADGNDRLQGGDGGDMLTGGFGSDRLEGGAGNDILLSRSDAGEPVIAQNRAAAKVYPGEPLLAANDTLQGGAGADTFRFELTMDARPEVAARHLNADGTINWRAVAGENGNLHDHWVNGIGNDTIQDFSRAQGDRIEIAGHTVQATLRLVDSNRDGTADYSLITLRSNQGANGGAHHGDLLGTIKVYGDLLTVADFTATSNVHYGAYDTLDEARNTECCGVMPGGTHHDNHLMG